MAQAGDGRGSEDRTEGASVRIPAPVTAAVAIEVHQSAGIRDEDGRIITEPIRAPWYDLDDLPAAMTSGTAPDVIDSGTPVGREAW